MLFLCHFRTVWSWTWPCLHQNHGSPNVWDCRVKLIGLEANSPSPSLVCCYEFFQLFLLFVLSFLWHIISISQVLWHFLEFEDSRLDIFLSVSNYRHSFLKDGYLLLDFLCCMSAQRTFSDTFPEQPWYRYVLFWLLIVPACGSDPLSWVLSPWTEGC